MVATCRKAGVDVIVDTVINNMTSQAPRLTVVVPHSPSTTGSTDMSVDDSLCGMGVRV
jgi:hypothetical protein